MYSLKITDPALLDTLWHSLEAEPCIVASTTVKEFRISDENDIVFVRYQYQKAFVEVYAQAANAKVIAGLRAEAQLVNGTINGFLRRHLTHPPDGKTATQNVKFTAS